MSLQAVKDIENMVNQEASMQFMTLVLLSSVGKLAEKIEYSKPCHEEIGNVLTCAISIVKIKSDFSICNILEKIIANQNHFHKTIELHEALSLIFKQVGKWSESGFPLTDRYNLLESIIYDLMYIANFHGYKLLDCLNISNDCEAGYDL